MQQLATLRGEEAPSMEDQVADNLHSLTTPFVSFVDTHKHDIGGLRP